MSKTLTYNTFACVLQIKQGVHLANWASKRHLKVLLADTMAVTPCRNSLLSGNCSEKNRLVTTFRFDQYAQIVFGKRRVVTNPFFSELLPLKREFLHGVTSNSLKLSFSPCKATSLSDIWLDIVWKDYTVTRIMRAQQEIKLMVYLQANTW